jgi:hypothetical protein
MVIDDRSAPTARGHIDEAQTTVIMCVGELDGTDAIISDTRHRGTRPWSLAPQTR